MITPTSTRQAYIVLAVQIDERVSNAMAHDLALRSVDRCIEDVSREFHIELESMTVLDDLNFASGSVNTPVRAGLTLQSPDVSRYGPPLAELSPNESEVMPTEGRRTDNRHRATTSKNESSGSVATPLGEENSNSAAKISSGSSNVAGVVSTATQRSGIAESLKLPPTTGATNGEPEILSDDPRNPQSERRATSPDRPQEVGRAPRQLLEVEV